MVPPGLDPFSRTVTRAPARAVLDGRATTRRRLRPRTHDFRGVTHADVPTKLRAALAKTAQSSLLSQTSTATAGENCALERTETTARGGCVRVFSFFGRKSFFLGGKCRRNILPLRDSFAFQVAMIHHPTSKFIFAKSRPVRHTSKPLEGAVRGGPMSAPCPPPT